MKQSGHISNELSSLLEILKICFGRTLLYFNYILDDEMHLNIISFSCFTPFSFFYAAYKSLIIVL